MFRRFDDVIHYDRPDAEQAKQLVRNRLHVFLGRQPEWKDILQASAGLSHAEISRACDDAAKDCILADRKSVDTEMLVSTIRERRRSAMPAESTSE